MFKVNNKTPELTGNESHSYGLNSLTYKKYQKIMKDQ